MPIAQSYMVSGSVEPESLASRDTKNDPPSNLWKKGRKIHWGAVFHRTYLRQLGGACGIPDENGVCEWPIGLSNYTVIYCPESKEIVAENVHSGVICPITENGMSVISEFDSWNASSTQFPSNNREKALSLEHCSLDGSNRPLYILKPGERYMGTIDEVVGAREKAKNDAIQERRKRLEQLLNSTKRPTLRDKEELEALSELCDPYDWRLDSKQRKDIFQHTLHVLPKDYPNLNALASALTEEAAEILQSRNASNSGCRCGLIIREEIAAVDIEVLRGECQIRGLPATGGRKALVERLVADSLRKIGCTHREFSAPYQQTAESLDKEACLVAACKKNPFVLALKERDRERFKEIYARHCISEADGTTDPTKPVFLTLPDFPADYPLNSPVSSDSETPTEPDATTEPEEASDAKKGEGASTTATGPTSRLRVQSLLCSRPDTNPLCVLVSENDPRLLEAHLKAVVFQRSLEVEEETKATHTIASPSASGPLALIESIPCPCSVNQVGCHHGTCACDEEACGNRSFFDFTAAVHDDSPIELYRQIIRILFVNFGGKIHFFNPSLVLYAKNTVLKYTAQDSETDASQEDAASTTDSNASHCDEDKKPTDAIGTDANDATSPSLLADPAAITPAPVAADEDPAGLSPEIEGTGSAGSGTSATSPGTCGKTVGVPLIELLANLGKSSIGFDEEDSFDFSHVDTSSLPPYVTTDDLLASRLVLSEYKGPEAKYSIFHPNNLVSPTDSGDSLGKMKRSSCISHCCDEIEVEEEDEVDGKHCDAASSNDHRKRKRNDTKDSQKHRKQVK